MTWKIGSLVIKTPLILASGTWGLGDTLIEYLSLEEIRSSIGALITKGLSLEPMAGNPPPRLMEAPCGLINSIGLENPGIEVFLKRYYPRLRDLEVPVIFNLHGSSVDEFIKLVRYLEEENIRGVELNISCPNVTEGGIAFSQSPEAVFQLVKKVREIFSGLLIVKLSPVGPVLEVALACKEAAADALTIANTYPAMGIISYEPLKVIKGGLSGPAIKPLTLRLVSEIIAKVTLPIIASGGVLSGKDVFEYLLVGASAVQVGTANLIDPRSVIKIHEELKELLQRHGRLLNKGHT